MQFQSSHPPHLYNNDDNNQNHHNNHNNHNNNNNNRYNLLFKDLLSKTREDHPDYEGLLQACKKIEQTAVTINEDVRHEEKVGKREEESLKKNNKIKNNNNKITNLSPPLLPPSHQSRSLTAISKIVGNLPNFDVNTRHLLSEGEIINLDKQGRKVWGGEGVGRGKQKGGIGELKFTLFFFSFIPVTNHQPPTTTIATIITIIIDIPTAIVTFV